MSGAGRPGFTSDARGLTVTVVAAGWHKKIAEALIAGAERALDRAGATYTVVRVAGSFELAVVSQAAFAAGADAVVALGVIIRGDTPHFDYVCSATTEGLTRVALEAGRPVGFGVLTVDSKGQALARAGLAKSREDKGAEAAEAALQAALTMRALAQSARAASRAKRSPAPKAAAAQPAEKTAATPRTNRTAPKRSTPAGAPASLSGDASPARPGSATRAG